MDKTETVFILLATKKDGSSCVACLERDAVTADDKATRFNALENEDGSGTVYSVERWGFAGDRP
jgi:hypothetical protein